MLKEIKYVFYIITIILFSFLSTKYYFSDEHIKKNYRMIDLVDKNIDTYSEKIPFLESNTKKIIEYVENVNNSNKKKYHFWELLFNNEK
tara:strand:- start:1550 stop:1816 length:267 start_codon:yes stop_codon:yes gene_type:complete